MNNKTAVSSIDYWFFVWPILAVLALVGSWGIFGFILGVKLLTVWAKIIQKRYAGPDSTNASPVLQNAPWCAAGFLALVWLVGLTFWDWRAGSLILAAAFFTVAFFGTPMVLAALNMGDGQVATSEPESAISGKTETGG